jgi:hypothetical protein
LVLCWRAGRPAGRRAGTVWSSAFSRARSGRREAGRACAPRPPPLRPPPLRPATELERRTVSKAALTSTSGIAQPQRLCGQGTPRCGHRVRIAARRPVRIWSHLAARPPARCYVGLLLASALLGSRVSGGRACHALPVEAVCGRSGVAPLRLTRPRQAPPRPDALSNLAVLQSSMIGNVTASTALSASHFALPCFASTGTGR